MPAATERHPISYSGAPVFSLAALIPLILVLMTVTGAVYPAIDLTAGERERGTLETLIAAPVPRLGLLFAKYVAVLTVALLTAVVNLIGMTITAHSSGLGGELVRRRDVVRRGGESAAAARAVRRVLFGDPARAHQLCAELQGGAGVHHSADAVVPGAGRAVLAAGPGVHRVGWR